MNYVAANKIGNRPGVYSKWLGEGESFYGSYHAAHILDMFGELEKLPPKDIDAWAGNILQYQSKYGHFSTKDEWKEKEFRLPEEMDAILHSTRGAIWTLRVLNRKPRYEFRFFEQLLNARKLYQWVKSYDWGKPWEVSNQICAAATILFAMRDWFGITEVDQIIEEGMYPALEELIDENTGFWGTRAGASLPHGLYATIHIIPIYFAQGWPIKHVERSVDSTLACQLPNGSFPDGRNCPDFDGAYMITNLAEISEYRLEDLKKAARLYLENALMHEDPNGMGWLSLRRDSPPEAYRPSVTQKWTVVNGKRVTDQQTTTEEPKTHVMLDSWFYPLSIALIAHMLGDTGYEGPYRLTPAALHQCNASGFNVRCQLIKCCRPFYKRIMKSMKANKGWIMSGI